MLNARLYLGDRALRVASALARVGRALIGVPVVRLIEDAPEGASVLVLDHVVPDDITKGVKILADEGGDDEGARAVAIHGNRVSLDRKLMRSWPAGQPVKLLI